MKLNVAVQMDPIERINIRGDSTFALLLEAQKRGHGLSYYTPDKLSLNGEELVAPVQLLTVRDEPGDHFTLGEPRREPLAAFDVILLRQDPPFDLAYITSTHLLERLHPKTLVVNDPASVRNAPEKIFVMDFPHLMPPTLISRDLDEGHKIATFGDDVDLAMGRAKAFGENPITLGHQKRGGAAFGRQPGAKGRDPLGRGGLRGLVRRPPVILGFISLGHDRPSHGPAWKAQAREHRFRGGAGRIIRPHAPPRP